MEHAMNNNPTKSDTKTDTIHYCIPSHIVNIHFNFIIYIDRKKIVPCFDSSVGKYDKHISRIKME